MFETIHEVPSALLGFYHEKVVSEPTGNMVEEAYEYTDDTGETQTGTRLVPEYHDVTYVRENARGETGDSVAAVLKRNAEDQLVNHFLGIVNNTLNWEFHDNYLAWLEQEPIPEDDMFYIMEEDAKVYSPELFDEAHILWASEEPVKPEPRELTYYPEHIKWCKLRGVLFNGVKCSATKEDMWGLSSVEATVRAGHDINFDFDSGDTLVLTADNIDAFQAVWVPFRLSFFN